MTTTGTAIMIVLAVACLVLAGIGLWASRTRPRGRRRS